MRFPLLKSARLCLVDVQVKPFRLECGWCHASPGLQEYETLTAESGETIAIVIPLNLRELSESAMFYFPDEPVEFLRMLP